MIGCAQTKHLIGSVAAICAAYSADKEGYRLRESLSVVNFSGGPNRPDQITGIIPGRTVVLVWVDIQDRPDLFHMNQRHEGGGGDFVATWFFVEPGKRHMLVGLRVEVRAPFTAIFSLIFPLKHSFQQLESIAENGLIWVEPGPPPDASAGPRAMNVSELLAVVGDGISLDLEEPQRQQLRGILTAWKQR